VRRALGYRRRRDYAAPNGIPREGNLSNAPAHATHAGALARLRRPVHRREERRAADGGAVAQRRTARPAEAPPHHEAPRFTAGQLHLRMRHTPGALGRARWPCTAGGAAGHRLRLAYSPYKCELYGRTWASALASHGAKSTGPQLARATTGSRP
jgi:hypothetical protein